MTLKSFSLVCWRQCMLINEHFWRLNGRCCRVVASLATCLWFFGRISWIRRRIAYLCTAILSSRHCFGWIKAFHYCSLNWFSWWVVGRRTSASPRSDLSFTNVDYCLHRRIMSSDWTRQSLIRTFRKESCSNLMIGNCSASSEHFQRILARLSHDFAACFVWRTWRDC